MEKGYKDAFTYIPSYSKSIDETVTYAASFILDTDKTVLSFATTHGESLQRCIHFLIQQNFKLYMTLLLMINTDKNLKQYDHLLKQYINLCFIRSLFF